MILNSHNSELLAYTSSGCAQHPKTTNKRSLTEAGMQHYSAIQRGIPHILAYSGASIALAFACTAASPDSAQALTAAEKQAEADAVYAQIDSLQTNLNKAMDEYDKAQAAYEKAVKKRDKAQKSIEEETRHIEQLQSDIAQFAKGMYKKGGAGSLLDVMMDAESFDQFIRSWDACNAVFAQGQEKLHETQKAREALEAAEAAYQAQSERAEGKMNDAERAKAEIEDTQAALREQAEQLSAEAAELQRQEELAAEAARQAEEARQRREAELAEAAKAAEEARAAQEIQALAEQEEEATEGQDSEEYGDEEETELETESENDPETELEDESSEEEAASEPVVVGAGYFTHPCPGATNSSGFGYRTFDNSFHMGLDMAAPEGTPYYAADGGTVLYATNDGGYNGGAGNWVVIAHGNGIVTKYMHSSATYVVPGDYVERGQNIGAVGNTGNSFGAHLHFQVEIGGVAVNPLNYL